MLTFEQIKELVELVVERRLQGLEIERAGFRLKITGQDSLAASPADQGAAAPEPSAEEPPPTPRPAPAPPDREEADEGALPEGIHVLKSPIVGTFYSAPSPDADPYVGVGDRVKRGQVLCIVEAMKLMNEIESDADGEVLEIYPQNAQPVEFGEPLFAIRPS